MKKNKSSLLILKSKSKTLPIASSPPSILNAFIIYAILPLVLLSFINFIDDDILATFVNNLKDSANANTSASIVVERKMKDDEIPKFKSQVEGKPPIPKSATANINNEGSNNHLIQKETPARAKPKMNDRTYTIYKLDENINILREIYEADKNDKFKALNLADALRQRDLVIHDGGSIQYEAIKTYKAAIQLMQEEHKSIIASGIDVKVSKNGHYSDANDEIFLRNEEKSIQPLLVSTFCSLGKQYYMANMFEKAVEAYDSALQLEESYIDALSSRASASIILGKYSEAGSDYSKVLSLDRGNGTTDIFTGIAQVLKAKEDAIPGGWTQMTNILNDLIPIHENRLASITVESSGVTIERKVVSDALKRMHLAMFAYHDHKTLDTAKAWYHLEAGQRYKMSILPQYDTSRERMKVEAVMNVFGAGFWSAGVGSSSRTNIFIVGFPRSGSTLLERVLDSHSQIVGTGEDSIFNGMLDEIRNAIVEASMTGSQTIIKNVVQQYADKVENNTRRRWEEIHRNTGLEQNKKGVKKPKRFVDKMLTNYLNIGFIHLLFPNALILHVIRHPMDTLFSAFKHDFPAGSLDYTSEFTSLFHMYCNYRDIMDHWDKVLPGRVLHVNYEDMVNDMPSIAQSIIRATKLQWEPDVLNFHKQKHAVNTLSTVQVRKGIYKDSLQSWKRYQAQLQPLVKAMNSYTTHNFKTTLKT